MDKIIKIGLLALLFWGVYIAMSFFAEDVARDTEESMETITPTKEQIPTDADELERIRSIPLPTNSGVEHWKLKKFDNEDSGDISEDSSDISEDSGDISEEY